MQGDDDLFITLFASCIIVQGVKRSIICDLQRWKYEFIPNSLVEVSPSFKKFPLSELKSAFAGENLEIFNGYINFLLENEFAFLCSKEELDLFSEIPLTWDTPELISNAILDHRDWTKHNYSKLAEEFNQIGCKALQLRFFDDESIEKIAEVVSQFDDTRIRHIDILAKYNDSLNEANLRDLCFQYSRISYFVLFESPIETEYKCHNSNATLYFIEDKISGAHHCGKIASSSFKVSTELFIESNNYNSCLNKKISVDEQGFIKNCPSMAGNYGHHQEVSLKSVAETDKFKEYWKISKSQITTCKVCEFRHVCTDCRAYLEMPTDRYSKPLKCGYNPYTAEWEVWSDNPLKRETAEHYNLNNG